jgi:hypothetical protein
MSDGIDMRRAISMKRILLVAALAAAGIAQADYTVDISRSTPRESATQSAA